MLKLAKWAYDLGIRHERVRLAAHLQLHSTGARNSVNTINDMFSEEMSKSKPNKNRLQRMEFDRAVNHRIGEIIQDMFQDTGGYYVSGTSIMFPDDDHKDPVK